MAQRDEGILDLLTELPWWVGVIAAGVTYAGMRFVLPGYLDSGPLMAPYAELSRMFALPVTGLVLLAAAISAFRSLRDRLAAGGPTGTVRNCPHCGSQLVMRRASRGARAGSRFWGCSSYPKCRYTEDVAG